MLRSHYVLGEEKIIINIYLIENKEYFYGFQGDCVYARALFKSWLMLLGRNILCRITVPDDPVCFFSLMYIVSQFRC